MHNLHHAFYPVDSRNTATFILHKLAAPADKSVKKLRPIICCSPFLARGCRAARSVRTLVFAARLLRSVWLEITVSDGAEDFAHLLLRVAIILSLFNRSDVTT